MNLDCLQNFSKEKALKAAQEKNWAGQKTGGYQIQKEAEKVAKICFSNASQEATTHLQSTINNLCFGILQGTRTRISKTEYISCPSCGRTLFDLQETTQKIRSVTNHLKGLKIAIMGCIVNGPGEMADADYGYVGSGVGKITLYKGKEVIRRNIDSSFALNELINLIQENGHWVEKQVIA